MLYFVKTSSKNIENESKNPLYMVFFVITKKIYKKAVDRNRVKRRAKKAFADAIKQIQQEQVDNTLLNNFLIKNKIIFFLERDMIHEVYENIVIRMKHDLIRLITHNK